jgi:hypothetical protein
MPAWLLRKPLPACAQVRGISARSTVLGSAMQ